MPWLLVGPFTINRVQPLCVWALTSAAVVCCGVVRRGLNTSNAGALQVPGLALGNVWIGVQPPLGIEGDPMRLLFERDLTPHPQYAAFYKWLQHVSAAAAAAAAAAPVASLRAGAPRGIDEHIDCSQRPARFSLFTPAPHTLLPIAMP